MYFKNKNVGFAKVTLKQLSKETGMSKEQTKQHIQELIKARLVISCGKDSYLTTGGC